MIILNQNTVLRLYHVNCALFISTNLQVFNKDVIMCVKINIKNKYKKELKHIYIFDSTRPKIRCN